MVAENLNLYSQLSLDDSRQHGFPNEIILSSNKELMEHRPRLVSYSFLV